MVRPLREAFDEVKIVDEDHHQHGESAKDINGGDATGGYRSAWRSFRGCSFARIHAGHDSKAKLLRKARGKCRLWRCSVRWRKIQVRKLWAWIACWRMRKYRGRLRGQIP